MKPGAYGLIWALPRISHRTATAAEMAGFEIIDIVHHTFGSGYPTGQHISKAFDKREKKGIKVRVTSGRGSNSTMYGSFGSGDASGEYEDSLPESELAQKWYGWHSRLKPAVEHWVLVQKPFNTSIIENVEMYGTGALNIEACRVEGSDGYQKAWDKPVSTNIGPDGYLLQDTQRVIDISGNKPIGRFTANLILSHHPDCLIPTGDTIEQCTTGGLCVEGCPVALLDEQSGITTSKKSQRGKVQIQIKEDKKHWTGESTERGHNDSGGASRYFNQFSGEVGYYKKVSPNEKFFFCKGCNQVFPARDGKQRLDVEHKPHGIVEHPTPKSKALMNFLITLITPPEGTVLDPFFGTGSTGVSCQELGFDCVGIDMSEDYLRIARYRLGGG